MQAHPSDFEILIDAASIPRPGLQATHSELAGNPLPAPDPSYADNSKYAGLPETTLFRLVEFRLENGAIHLETGSTSYSDYRRTRCASVPIESRWSALANPLAVSCVCRTRDNFILIEKREDDVDLYPGFFHVVGGYTERDLDCCDSRSPLGDVVPDLSSAMCREMAEELGGVQPTAGSMSPTGLVYERFHQHPELCFMADLDESWDEVLEATLTTPEFNDMIRLRNDPGDLSEFLSKEKSRIAPTGKGSLLLYGQRVFGLDWFNKVYSELAEY